MFPGKAPPYQTCRSGIPFRILPQAALRANFVTPPTRAVDPLDPPLLHVTRLAFTWIDLNRQVFTWFSECTLIVANATHR